MAGNCAIPYLTHSRTSATNNTTVPGWGGEGEPTPASFPQLLLAPALDSSRQKPSPSRCRQTSLRCRTHLRCSGNQAPAARALSDKVVAVSLPTSVKRGANRSLWLHNVPDTILPQSFTHLPPSPLTAVAYMYLRAFVEDGPFGGILFCCCFRGWGLGEHSHCKRVSWDVYVMLFIPRLLQL